MAWISSLDLMLINTNGLDQVRGSYECGRFRVWGYLLFFCPPSVFFFSRELCVRVLCISGAELLCVEVITMTSVYFKTDTSQLVRFFFTADGKMDFFRLGRETGFDPTSIKLNSCIFPEGLKWETIEEVFKEMDYLLERKKILL